MEEWVDYVCVDAYVCVFASLCIHVFFSVSECVYVCWWILFCFRRHIEYLSNKQFFLFTTHFTAKIGEKISTTSSWCFSSVNRGIDQNIFGLLFPRHDRMSEQEIFIWFRFLPNADKIVFHKFESSRSCFLLSDTSESLSSISFQSGR